MIITKRKIPSLGILFLCLVASFSTLAQSVDDLINSYSGKTVWNAEARELTFATAGVITFSEKGTPKQHFWNVPKNVKIVTIEADVRVVGAFHSQADLTIQGKHRVTSVVYGTDLRSWAQKNEVKAFRHCQFQNFGGVLTIRNLTSLNPYGFHVTF